MKSSTMPLFSGPGRYIATTAIRSSMFSGLSRRSRSWMPDEPNWNTAFVSPRPIRSYVFASSSGTAWRSSAWPRLALTSSSVLSTIVSVRRPSRSIFSMPAFSRSFMANWLMTTSFILQSGMNSTSGLSAMTTPAAWVEAWRASPSSLRA